MDEMEEWRKYMLINVNVKNLALIKEADICFGEGLNILTGETGAGKSIIIGSILIALGGKVPKEMIKDDKKEALVELVFQVQNPTSIKKMVDMGVNIDEEGQLIISRKILNGRSTTKVNGENFTNASLKSITELLIDIHGQHDHQSLLKKEKQLQILDDFAGDDVYELKNDIKREYSKYTSLKNQLSEYDIDDDMRSREISFCQFEIDEIDNAHMRKGEFGEIEDSYKKMSSAKSIIEKMGEVYDIIDGSGYDSVSDKISQALRLSQSACEMDNDIADITDSIADMESICQDVKHNIKTYIDNMFFDEEEIRNVETRLDELNRLRGKYEKKHISDDVVDNILAYRQEQAEKLEILLNLEEKKNTILEAIKKSEDKLSKLCKELTYKRKENANIFKVKVEEILKGLNFLDVKFEINFSQLNNYTSNGLDDIEFIISTNPGESPKPLKSVASGGELSRIMLGIKTIMAAKDEIETLIFDEIDTGISGRTAQMVAERMKDISKIHQVICITHLPQIAAMSDNHYLIEKRVENDVTHTSIEMLDYESSVKELARMLGGVEITKVVLENAEEMKKLANN
jgi:DNA repair protein RecN (Recombination protein N)